MATSSSSSPLFLGFDLSTQQLKAAILDRSGSFIHESSVHFDRELPQLGTTNGALHGDLPGEVYCNVVVWIEALDLLMNKLKAAGVQFGDIVAISGAAQQHGSVYWDDAASPLLQKLDATQPLACQLVPEAFSTCKCPIWQDSSTTEECQIIEKELGGSHTVSNLTGSRAYERFTGAQIFKLYRKHRGIYDATGHISLISSFLASLFLCAIAPIEVSDASGMNLMDIETHKWSKEILEVCGGPTLRAKLGPEPVEGGTVMGTIGKWWVDRWGFKPSCIIAPFTGDNPSTVVSLSSHGDVILSLGTSTTLLISIPPSTSTPKRTVTSHLLADPTDRDSFIAMLCYKNGALAREYVRDHHSSKDWSVFNKLVESTPTGNDGYMGFYFPLFEIIPQNVIGDFFFHNGELIPSFEDPKYHPRAILESQLLSIRSRIISILPKDSHPLKRLLLTGGSSANEVIRQMAADILHLDTYVAESKEGGTVGGALLAMFAWWKQQGGEGGLDELKKGLKSDGFKLVAKPDAERAEIYEDSVGLYRKCEHKVVELNANKGEEIDDDL
ncbi:hypothetical protein FS842_004476 [Serendipita sp. 407]|nr:hypothetical protein FS842_004476 [Serendipita sp. 407]